MKKADVPQPKYSIGEAVIYIKQSDMVSVKKEIGKVSHINIAITAGSKGVSYKFESSDEEYGEGCIIRRVVLD